MVQMVSFLSAVNFEQHYSSRLITTWMISAFLTGYQEIYIISLFPLTGSSIRTSLKTFENGQNIHRTHVAERLCFEKYRVNFVTSILENESPNLHPSMSKRLLNRRVQFAAVNSNFPWIYDRDLRSIVQYARVSFPYHPASDLSISSIPYAWNIIVNLSPYLHGFQL
jgi:hypothetical protein